MCVGRNAVNVYRKEKEQVQRGGGPERSHWGRAQPIFCMIIPCDEVGVRLVGGGQRPHQCCNNYVIVDRKLTQPSLHVVCSMNVNSEVASRLAPSALRWEERAIAYCGIHLLLFAFVRFVRM